MKLRLARLALIDLEDIRASSRTRWGARLTRDYLHAIDATMQRAARRPLQFASLDELPRYRKARSGQHLVYFIYDDVAGEVNVVRILHERMDAVSQLSDD